MIDQPVNSSSSLCVICPANNEQSLIGTCLESLLASDWSHDARLDILIVANGCTDQTVPVARAYAPRFAERGFGFEVLDLEEGGKLNALNAGDARTDAPLRAYLDADVTLGPTVLDRLYTALDTPEPRYASAHVVMPRPATWASRAYRRYYRNVPFMTTGVPGCGLFAVNAAGRARWGQFPDIISDDTFVRLSFTPEERVMVDACYDWPLVEGFGTLVKVRRRQDAGVQEIRDRFPDLLGNDDDRPFPLSRKLALGLRDPVAFAVYSAVAVMVRLTGQQSQDWSRGR